MDIFSQVRENFQKSYTLEQLLTAVSSFQKHKRTIFLVLLISNHSEVISLFFVTTRTETAKKFLLWLVCYT